MREVWIALVARCVRIPGEIEPELRPALAVARIGEQGVDQLPIGTLLQGKVVGREQVAQAQTQQVIYKVVLSLLNTPLAGSKLSLETPLALPLGSLLSAQVQGSQALNFLPLSGRLDQLALSQQLGSQNNRQGSLEGLFSALQGLRGNAEMSEGLRTSIDKLFGALPDAAQLSTAKGLAAALENSGILLESKLLGGQGHALPNDLKANLLRLITQLLPNLPSGTPLATASTASSALAQAMPALARDLLGNIGKASSRQQALNFPLPSRLLQAMEGEADLARMGMGTALYVAKAAQYKTDMVRIDLPQHALKD